MKHSIAIVSLLLTAITASAEKPNFIFILSDDIAQGDLGVYGQKLIQTPTLDRLANEGGTASGAAQVGGETHGLVLRGNASDRIIAAVVVRVVKTPHASGVCLTVAARGRARDLSNGVHPHYC